MTLNADLIPIERKDETPLRSLSQWVIYRLCRDGKLPHVKVGRRVYLTTDGIAAFMARGGERQLPSTTPLPAHAGMPDQQVFRAELEKAVRQLIDEEPLLAAAVLRYRDRLQPRRFAKEPPKKPGRKRRT